ncbi:hypothetical protein [Kibdelosporangium aridum]|nr:hypothetical protein [Kibdelosporangium aridum]
MITADGRNQYALAEPENALNYVRTTTNTTPHLVWRILGRHEDPVGLSPLLTQCCCEIMPTIGYSVPFRVWWIRLCETVPAC